MLSRSHFIDRAGQVRDGVLRPWRLFLYQTHGTAESTATFVYIEDEPLPSPRRSMSALTRGVAHRSAVRLAPLALLAAIAFSGEASAQFQTPLEAIQASKGAAEWSERFDATLPEVRQVKSSVPTVTAQTPGAIEIAIQRYSAIASRGGWPVVPATADPLRLGARDQAVAVLRERLTVSGDLRQSRGQPEVFDSYVDAAVRRFQLRHGLMLTAWSTRRPSTP